MKVSACPNCKSKTLYRSEEMSSGGGHAPNYLPGLGKGFRSARFEIILCRDCGMTRFFATVESRRKVSDSKKWRRVVPSY